MNFAWIFSKAKSFSLSFNVSTTVPMKDLRSAQIQKRMRKWKLPLMFVTTLASDSKDTLSLSLLHCLVVNSSTLSSIISHSQISRSFWQITLQIYAVPIASNELAPLLISKIPFTPLPPFKTSKIFRHFYCIKFHDSTFRSENRSPLRSMKNLSRQILCQRSLACT